MRSGASFPLVANCPRWQKRPVKFIKVGLDRFINAASIKEVLLGTTGFPGSAASHSPDEVGAVMVVFMDGKREPFKGGAALNIKNAVLGT